MISLSVAVCPGLIFFITGSLFPRVNWKASFIAKKHATKGTIVFFFNF